MNKINYQHELEQIIEKLQAEGRRPSLLLHACCAPCSSYCLEYLTRYFDITVYYYNPNITDRVEYDKRVEEMTRFLRETGDRAKLIVGPYDPERFYEIAKGLEDVPEGGERCFRCYALRLQKAALEARAGGFDYVTTTLTISPLKNSQKLNEIGQKFADEIGGEWLPSDFKKKNGYKRSVELSAEYHLYRQNYCGCEFSKREAERREAVRDSE